MPSYFQDGTGQVELRNPVNGYGLLCDLGEVEAVSAGNVTYCYVKGAVRKSFDELTFRNLTDAQVAALGAFLERNRGGLTFTYVDYAGTSCQVINRTSAPLAVRDRNPGRWSVTLTLEMIG